MTDFLIDTNALPFLGLRSDQVSEASLTRLRDRRRFVSPICGIAQAINEGLIIVTRDKAFEAYVGLDIVRI